MDNGSGIRRHHYVYSTYQRSSNAPSKLGPHLCNSAYSYYLCNHIFGFVSAFKPLS
jgi:hypothetical protein